MHLPSQVSQALAAVVRPLVAFSLSLAFAAGAHAAVVRTVDGSGILTGATGIDVSGVLYNVTFSGSSCQSVFDGCNQLSDFAFNSSSGAESASLALLAQVFIGSPGDAFDDRPELTAGCGNTTGCYITTPYALSFTTLNPLPSEKFLGRYAFNSSGADLDSTGANGNYLNSPLSPNFTFAKWTRAESVPVPEPSSLALLGVAGVVLGWSQHRRRRHTIRPAH